MVSSGFFQSGHVISILRLLSDAGKTQRLAKFNRTHFSDLLMICINTRTCVIARFYPMASFGGSTSVAVFDAHDISFEGGDTDLQPNAAETLSTLLKPVLSCSESLAVEDSDVLEVEMGAHRHSIHLDISYQPGAKQRSTQCNRK